MLISKVILEQLTSCNSVSYIMQHSVLHHATVKDCIRLPEPTAVLAAKPLSVSDGCNFELFLQQACSGLLGNDSVSLILILMTSDHMSSTRSLVVICNLPMTSNVSHCSVGQHQLCLMRDVICLLFCCVHVYKNMAKEQLWPSLRPLQQT